MQALKFKASTMVRSQFVIVHIQRKKRKSLNGDNLNILLSKLDCYSIAPHSQLKYNKRRLPLSTNDWTLAHFRLVLLLCTIPPRLFSTHLVVQ